MIVIENTISMIINIGNGGDGWGILACESGGIVIMIIPITAITVNYCDIALLLKKYRFIIIFDLIYICMKVNNIRLSIIYTLYIISD